MGACFAKKIIYLKKLLNLTIVTGKYLLLTEEMFKKGMDCPQAEGIINYFLERDVLYRHDNSSIVVIWMRCR